MGKLSQLKVIKRDGRKVPFRKYQIAKALQGAFLDAYEGISTEHETKIKELTNLVCEEISQRFNETIKIYEIQNVVEYFLVESGEAETARSYVNYRLNRDIERQDSKDVKKAIEKLSRKDRSVVNENANKDSRVFSTIRDLTAGSVARAVGLEMLPPHVANAHHKGEIHWHDLDYSPYTPLTNCCLIDFETMWEDGFKLGNAEIVAPNSIQTATAQVAQIIANVSSNQYGGATVNRIDELLAPYAIKNFKKRLKANLSLYVATSGSEMPAKALNSLIASITPDNITEVLSDSKKVEWFNDTDALMRLVTETLKQTRKDIYDAMQSLEYELNTIYTSASQTPFCSLGFGLGEDWSAREIQKAIFKVRVDGLGENQRTAVFPKLIYTLKRGLNLEKGDLNFDITEIALDCTTKRTYPDVLSYDKIVELTGSFKAPMGCRSFLHGWKDPETGEEKNEGRMNLGVVTLNLPRIALEAAGDKERFWEIFEERMDTVHDALKYRIVKTCEATPENAPILYMNGVFGKRLGHGDSVEEIFNKDRATISVGYIGLYEVGTVFYGGDWQGNNEEAREFTLEVLHRMKSKCSAWSNVEGFHYSLYSTPSESLTDRFCRLDGDKFGSVEDITDKGYYTNSFHFDSRKSPTPFEKIEFEKDYPKFSSAGFIHYYELPDLSFNHEAVLALWQYNYDKVGYWGLNFPIDHCYECGFTGDFEPNATGYQCPECGNANPDKMDVVKRLCGYLGSLSQRPPVVGRQKEINSRSKNLDSDIF